MELIRDIYAAKGAAGQPVISVEFFTPKTAEGERNLLERTVPALKAHGVDYCSVTYGAGGSTREKTLQIVETIQRDHGVTCMAHLTCVSTTRDQIGEVLREARQRGIRNILALRGDPPGGAGEFVPADGGFTYASELVTYIRELGGFSVGVAGFPEGHIDCGEGKQADWHHLKRKIDNGADFVITQLFFDNGDFYEFRDYVTGKLGVTVPVVPGLIPILSATQIRKFTTLCGARIPGRLGRRLEELGNDGEATAAFGVEYVLEQCEDLLRAGVPGLHFYTLNKAGSTGAVLGRLGFGGGAGTTRIT